MAELQEGKYLPSCNGSKRSTSLPAILPFCNPAISSSRIPRRRHRHPRAQPVFRILTGIEHDLDGHALDDLDVVAGRVFGRQERKTRAGGAGDAVDLAAVGAA